VQVRNAMRLEPEVSMPAEFNDTQREALLWEITRIINTPPVRIRTKLDPHHEGDEQKCKEEPKMQQH